MKVIYISFFVLLAAGLGSCKKFLNTRPTDALTGEEYYNTEAKIMNALAGVYDKLGSGTLYGDYLFSEWDACTDDSYYARSSAATGITVYNFDFTNDRIRKLWQDCYIGVERANQLIANINLPPISEDKRTVILNEAKFLRAYYYFLLVSRFGGVPLLLEPVTSPNNLEVARTPDGEVYGQILKDMEEAEAALPLSSAIGYPSRVSKTVAEGILARVCLYMAGAPLNDQAKYAEALSWAQKVKESGEHELNVTYNNEVATSAYSQIFINHSQDIYNIKESMWEVDFKGFNGDGYNESGRVGNTIGIAMTSTAFQNDTGYCYGFIKGTGRLFKLYGEGDQRREWTLQPYSYNGKTGARVPIVTTAANMYSRDAAKWRRSYENLRPKNKNTGPTNFPLLRYSDVLLMLAEAENQVNGPTQTAYDAINQVRRRAYGVDLSAPSIAADVPPGLSKDAFQLFIEDERSRELCFETLRRQDLIRWGKFLTAMKAVSEDMAANGGGVKYGALGGSNVSERNLLYPIPSGEIALNKKLVQNPGW